MHKAGIITFQGSNNCGSLLQAYALQQYLLNTFNLDTEIINFSNKKQKEMYAVFNRNNTLKNIVKNVLCFPHYKLLKTHFNDYAYFVNKFLKLSSNSYEESNEMIDLENQYDMFIAGSDQIWNIRCYDADDAYFLNFVHNKLKVAYAPSLGAVDLNKYAPNPQIYKNYLNDFRYLSVREENGKKWLKKLTGRNIPILPDPTLLIDQENWEQLVGEQIIDGDYIFYYAFNYPKEISVKLKELSQKLKMPIIMMDAKPWALRGPKYYGFSITEHSGPLVFLNLMKYAKYVVTTSLHGTIFSSIFEKDFWYLKGVLFNEDDDRSSFLLKQLDLQTRLIDVKELDVDNIDNMPDYTKTRERIKKLQQEAYQFWKSILDNM